MEPSARRRRYREDDEIDALYSLYQEPKLNDFDDDDDDDAIHMTAADIFGKPQKKYYDQYSKSNKTPRHQGRSTKGDDDDSWEDYDFEHRANDERATGWNDPFEEEDDMPHGQDGFDEDGDEEADENIPMKGRRQVSDSNSDSKKAAAASSSSTAHARHAEKLRQQTEQLEKDLLAEKPWQMTGETTSTSRPVDSLLSTTPEFEVASKPTPVITVEKTASLEETIKKRILNEDWDDVIPRELPDVGWESKRGELPEVSQEKSKLGLGELYEREYLKRAVGYDVTAAEKETQEEKAKNEMKSLFANLCSKLDALSNYHFAPRPIADEAEVRPLTKPAIAMEEVLPLHVSDARAVAPEEVYNSKRGREGVLRGESEHDQQDRKRLRASKKSTRRKRRQEKLADEKLISKLQPAGVGLDNPYEKRKIRQELSEARARGQVTAGEVDANNTDYGTALKISAKKKADNRNQKSSAALKL
jgi:U3 small nucleolar RNA-associated protein MPP10